jgi:pimeloyl-ACP methyl ester carboxylesterase
MTATSFHWTSADGLKLHAHDHAAVGPGDRGAVICLHGLTRNGRDFEDLAPKIAATGRRVLAADVRGRGQSDRDPNPGNYNPLVYAGDVISLMAAANLPGAIFIGTSMGGLITMTLSAMRPDLIAGIVLNDVGPEVGAAGLARIAGYVGGGSAVATWAEAGAYCRSINGEALPGLSDQDWMRFARRVFRETASGTLELDYDPAISNAFKTPDAPSDAAVPPDLWPLFTAMTAGKPLLLVRGALSDILEAPVADRMGEVAPQMVRVEVPGVGHAPTLDEPSAAQAILGFLADLP